MDKRPFSPTPRPYRLVDNPSDRDDPLANDNQGEKAHPNIEVGVLKAYLRKPARDSHHRPHFNPKQDKPNDPDSRRDLVGSAEGEEHLKLLVKISKGTFEAYCEVAYCGCPKHHGGVCNALCTDFHGLVHECKNYGILSRQQNPTPCQHQAQGLKCPQIFVTNAGRKTSSGGCETDHHCKLKGFASPFENRILRKPYIEQRHLQPCEPNNSEESHVGPQRWIVLAYEYLEAG